ncbi:MAG: PilT/PilU family type 4a pilus ATPase [Nitrospinaceae bacterium]|jgi:twitching motility protein PilT|nr:MAG: PilT/PilU family type 4a pilus ATPase [Nitrospinaceae bacterium]
MKKAEIDHILTTMLESQPNISDLNITPGKPFQVESSGELTAVKMEPFISKITPFQSEIFAMNIINSDRRLLQMLVRDGSCDCSYFLEGKVRFRVSIFSRQGQYSIVLRKLETRVPTIQEMDLPPQFARIAEDKNGLVLVTGATGSGKTTTLATILNKMNEDKAIHIITLEDPVEYLHPQKKATFNQRELGADYESFSIGLRAALRQAPKVILVGEMRDRETIEVGLSASETGHLVLSTLHTIDAGQTINRILGMFPQEEERHIRVRLADSLRWVISQRLVPKVGGGRIALFEVMASSFRVKDSIINGESEGKTFYEIITEGDAYGMWTFDQYILKIFKKGLITEETAMAYASRKAIVGRGIDTIKASKGERTTDIDDLSMDADYEEQLR